MHYKTNNTNDSLLNLDSNNHFFKTLKFLILLSVVFLPNLPSYGHLYGYNVQEWKNQKDNILVQFEVEPQTPSVGKNTIMNFSVQDLQTGEHLKNFTETVTISYYNSANVSSNDITYKFDSDQIKNGDFSHNYVFTKGGTYEIFLRVDTPTLITASKFTVFVSSPQFQIMNMIYLLLPVMIFSGIFAGIGITVWRYVHKKR